MRGPRVFLSPASACGIGLNVGSSGRADDGARSRSPKPTAAPFGSSIFDAVTTSTSSTPAYKQSLAQLQQPEHSPSQKKKKKNQQHPAFTSRRHYDRMVVRMEEIIDGTGTASVVVGPDCVVDSIGRTGATSTSWSIPLARAAHQPSLLSTECPTVFLANRKWYESNKPHRENVRLGVVAAVSDPEGRILLTRRAPHMRSFPRAWVMPGGGLDDGENLFDCLIREVKEETGVDVDPGSMEPFCLWESCYPTCGDDCISAGTGITAHYLVVFCLAKTTERDMSLLEKQVELDEQETDLALWLSANDFARILDHPLGGVDIGSSSVVSSASSSDTRREVALEDLCGIYPRGDAIKGIAQGNLFMLEELLHSKGGATFH